MKITILFANNDAYVDYMVFVGTEYKFYRLGIQADGYVHDIEVFKSKEEGNECFERHLYEPDLFGEIDYRRGTDAEIKAIRPFIIEKVKERVLKEFLG